MAFPRHGKDSNANEGDHPADDTDMNDGHAIKAGDKPSTTNQQSSNDDDELEA